MAERILKLNKNIKVLLLSESASLPTAVAEMTRVIFDGLIASHRGQYELSQIGLAHSLAITEPKWPVYPTKTLIGKHGQVECDPHDSNGEVTLREMAPKVAADIVFAFGEPSAVAPVCSSAKTPSKVVLYLKTGNFPIPADAGPILNRADRILTMSEWSRTELLACCPAICPSKVEVMYAPADVERFAPVAPEEKRELREALVPIWMPKDGFVLGWVGLARWRKQVWILYKLIHYLRTGKYLICSACDRVSLFDWDPLARCHLNETGSVLESRPGYNYDVCGECRSPNVRPAEPLDDVFLWLHMPQDDPLADWPLDWLEYQYGVHRNKDVYYTEGYSTKAALSPADLPALYQLWDCLLYLSGSSGFGLPAWEAMCCGIPVVYTDYSSHAEFLNRANAGLAVEGIFQPERKTGFWRIIADLPAAIAAVRKLYFNRQLCRELGASGRAFVQQYRAKIQVEKWHAIFQRLLTNEDQQINAVTHSAVRKC